MRLAILVAIIACAPGLALAEPTADSLAKDAEALAARGDFVGAAAKYRAAHALDPRPDLLCNVGVAYYKAKDLSRAHLHLGRCLTRGSSLDAAFLATVTAVFRALEDKLRAEGFVPVDIAVEPAGATVAVSAFAGEDPIVGATLVWLRPGQHSLTVRADGYAERVEAIDVSGTEQIRVRVALAKLLPAPRQRRVPAYVATGITGGLAIAAATTYLVARSYATDANSHAEDPTDTEYQPLVDKARRWQKVSWSLTAGAVVGAGVSAYLWYRATRSPGTRVEVAPTAGGAAVHVVGRF